MIIKEKFISASVNPRSHCLVASQTNPVVLYASSLQIAVQTIPQTEHQVGKILSLSEKRHSKPITVLKRLKSSGEEEVFVSGGVDSNVVLWSLNHQTNTVEYLTNLEGASGSVGSVCGATSNDDRQIIAATWVSELDSGFQVWWRKPTTGETTHSAQINLDQKAFALCVDSIFYSNTALLAVGTSKRFVELFAENESRTEFRKLISIAGHTDWIHSIAFNDNPNHLLVASAGQDTYVRLWHIEKDVGIEEENDEELTSSRNKFRITENGEEQNLRISSYAVMQGHDDWVHSTVWNRDGNTLLTASSDKTCIIWREIDDLWRDDVRLGIVGGQSAGFFSAVFSNDTNAIISSSYFGGLHAWRAEDDEKNFWSAVTMTGGQVGEVRDVDWHTSPDRQFSSFLISVGQDQTTRVFGNDARADQFVEIGRPQVHGHDMQCVAMVNSSVFVSGAEEKIFRAFRAPKSFVKSLESISGISTEKSFGNAKLADFGACVPALGLSNKPLCEGATVGEEQHWEEAAFNAAPTILEHAPTEDALQQNTLWPEEHKLYGHGYEVYAVAVNPTGNVLGTACKSSHAEHSVIILWSTADWSKKSEIAGHQSTVTQIVWNPLGTLLLSVSRDRTAKLYTEKTGDVDGFNYECIWSSTKQHSRIIWACDWFKQVENTFVTASRDQKIIIWKFEDNVAQPIVSSKCGEAVTAVAVSNGNLNSAVIVAGFQSGLLAVYRISNDILELLQEIGKSPITVDSAITRLRFSTSCSENQKLAVASADAKLRVYDVSI